MTKTVSATKKMLAVILAVLTMFSCMAVSASANTEDTNPIPDFEAIINDSATTTIPTITVKKFAQIDGKDVTVTITPNTNVLESYDKDGNYLYSNLTAGTKYTFTATYTDAAGKSYSKTDEVTLKIKQQAPAAPVPTKVTSKTITITKVTDCEYRLTYANGAVVNGYDWGNTTVFEKLTADTAYIVSIRKKATTSKYASEAASVTVKTLKAGDAKAADVPVLVDKTNTSIIVKEIEDVEFSIDKGATWQTSGKFENLTPDTIYGVIARKTFDPAVQDPNPSSEIFETKTNKRVRYTAAAGKCKFTVAEGTIYAEKDIAVTVIGDGPEGIYKDVTKAEYGDTWYIPNRVKVGEDWFKLTRSNDDVYTGFINPDASLANQKNVKVEVEYLVKKYDGEDWDPAGTATSTHNIDVGAEWGVLTMIAELFTKAANLFLNTIPQFFADMMGSESAGKFFSGIMDLIGKLGKIKLS